MKKGNIEKANGLNLILKDNVNQIDRACAISHKEDHEKTDSASWKRWMKAWIDTRGDLRALQKVITVMRELDRMNNTKLNDDVQRNVTVDALVEKTTEILYKGTPEQLKRIYAFVDSYLDNLKEGI